MRKHNRAEVALLGIVAVAVLSPAANLILGASLISANHQIEIADKVDASASQRAERAAEWADMQDAKVLELTAAVDGLQGQVYVLEDALEEAENAKIEKALLDRSQRLDDVVVTHYCACEACCGKAPGDPGYGITASGRKATEGVTVAVDPELIPLGSTVMVDYGDGEIHYYRADDVGGAIKGKHIDVYMADHQEALEAGRKTATVWWCEEGE